MNRFATAAFVIILASSTAFAQSPTPQGMPDASGITQCWDVLNNVSREKATGAGKLKETNDYQRTERSSNAGDKAQGPGAEPKDESGVTTGKSNNAEAKRGASIRPAGLPNC